MSKLALRLAAPAFAIAAFAVAGSALAAPPAWTVNKAASRINFVSSFEGGGFVGQFDRWDAQIAFDAKDLANSKAVVTVQTASAKTGDGDRDEALPSNDWFASSKFATATFTSTGFKSVGGDNYQVTGNLSLKGVTKPVTLPFTLKVAGKSATADGTVNIDRSLFGIGQGQFKGGDSVPLSVQVKIHVVATRP
jgi:polyisoprenoid-binding protein YceI